MVGERTGKVYRLADKIHVKIARVDLDDRKIDFVLSEGKTPARQTKTRTRREPGTKKTLTKKRTAMRRRKRSTRKPG